MSRLCIKTSLSPSKPVPSILYHLDCQVVAPDLQAIPQILAAMGCDVAPDFGSLEALVELAVSGVV